MRLIFTLGVIITLLSSWHVRTQNFANGALLGTIGISTTPTSWSQVAFGDPVCQATMALAATSDVTGTTGPMSGIINGNPYEGGTCVSGLHHTTGADTWHEGIQQSVSGLVIGQAYAISFWQCVIKQSNALDPQGSWSVYKESTLIGISTPTNDPAAYGTNTHTWQRRVLTFTATATTHLFKFLPRDDDANWVDPNSVRMGIDSVNLRLATILPEALDFEMALVNTDQVHLLWETDPIPNMRGYRVERSPNGYDFETAGEVNADVLDFVDTKPFIHSYYRLVRVMDDGATTYSEVKDIQTKGDVQVELDGRHVLISGGYGQGYQLTLIDMQGKTVFSEQVSSEADLGNLNPGYYFLQAISPGVEKQVWQEKVFLTEH
jgi:hypothetical protein